MSKKERAEFPEMDHIILSKTEFNHLLIQAFRYALLREFTNASNEMAEYIETYWDYIVPSFQDQIKRDAKNAIDTGQLKELDTIKAWEGVLKL